MSLPGVPVVVGIREFPGPIILSVFLLVPRGGVGGTHFPLFKALLDVDIFASFGVPDTRLCDSSASWAPMTRAVFVLL